MSIPNSSREWSRQTHFLPTGDRRPGEAFLAWRRYSQETPQFKTGQIVNGGCLSSLSDAEVAAYDAPFPDDSYQQGARQFPTLVPTTPDDPAAPDNRAERGNPWAAFSAHSCVRFRTQTRLPEVPTQSCARISPGRPLTQRLRSPAPATSCKKTTAKNWPR